jgi:hypothetical protein
MEAERVILAGADADAGWVGCTFTGLLRNTVPPWSGLPGAGPGMVARIVDSATPAPKQVLDGTWPHHAVFRSFQ